MLKISGKASVNLSLVISGGFFCVLAMVGVFLPKISNSLLRFSGEITARVEVTANDEVLALVAAYFILALALLANILLFTLLLQVKGENIFSSKSVSLIRGISWCSIGVGAIFALLTYYFTLSSVIAFAALFLGLCVRVVKNVIEKATEIKSENDFTV
ncbi:MAG: DUF2975 domain-containing protein [Clostridia bacterium]|nr:DUF2975 domain-containing protein [Clostridia bacterium]